MLKQMKKLLLTAALICAMLALTACGAGSSQGNISITVQTEVPVYSASVSGQGETQGVNNADGSQIAQGDTVYLDLHPDAKTSYTLTIYDANDLVLTQCDFILTGKDDAKDFTVTGLNGGLIINDVTGQAK